MVGGVHDDGRPIVDVVQSPTLVPFSQSQFGAMLRDKAAEAQQMSPGPHSRDPGLSPVAPADEEWTDEDELVTMRSAAPPSRQQAFSVVLRKTRVNGLGLRCGDGSSVTGYRGSAAKDAGVPLGATLSAVNGVELGTLADGGQHPMDRLAENVDRIPEGDDVDVEFTVSRPEPNSPRRRQLARSPVNTVRSPPSERNHVAHSSRILTRSVDLPSSMTSWVQPAAALPCCAADATASPGGGHQLLAVRRMSAVSPGRSYQPAPRRSRSPGGGGGGVRISLKDAAVLNVFTGSGEPGDNKQLTATPALLGATATSVVHVLCAMADPPLADDPNGLRNATEAYGRVLFIHRGGVPFTEKIRVAQASGAIGVVFINTTDRKLSVDVHHGDHVFPADTGQDLAIPCVGVGRSHGLWLADQLKRPLRHDIDGRPCRRAELRLSLRFDRRSEIEVELAAKHAAGGYVQQWNRGRREGIWMSQLRSHRSGWEEEREIAAVRLQSHWRAFVCRQQRVPEQLREERLQRSERRKARRGQQSERSARLDEAVLRNARSQNTDLGVESPLEASQAHTQRRR